MGLEGWLYAHVHAIDNISGNRYLILKQGIGHSVVNRVGLIKINNIFRAVFLYTRLSRVTCFLIMGYASCKASLGN
jgi:hypothetical protein